MVIFTNGCFDLLHVGHVRLLKYARSLGDKLIVGINDDESIRRLKGPDRPIVPLAERMELLSSLRCVDEVVAFYSDTPEILIGHIKPDIIVKGGDYDPTKVVGADVAKVVIFPLVPGKSSTSLISSVLQREKHVFLCDDFYVIATDMTQASAICPCANIRPLNPEEGFEFTSSFNGKIVRVPVKAADVAKNNSVGIFCVKE